jgi:hypothetical protein
MTRRQEIIVPIVLVIVIAAVGVVVGHALWGTPSVPIPTPKAALPLGCAPAPVTANAGMTVPSGVCYTVPPGGIVMDAGATIDGGLWTDANRLPCPYARCAPGTNRGRPAFLIKAPGVTLENMQIAGANVGGYDAKLAFNAGIETLGSAHTILTNVSIGHTYGDGLEVSPLRSGTGSNGVMAPTTNLVATNLSITAAGRQGITLASVNGAVFTNTTIGSTGFDKVDAEADQGGMEGAKNVVFNTASWNGLVSITAGGGATGPFTINGLTMPSAGSGDALKVNNTSAAPDAGAITIENSSIRCGQSVYVGCLELNGATVIMKNDAIDVGFGYTGSLRTPLYHADDRTILTFIDSTATGRVKPGTVDKTSRVINPIGSALP